MRVALLNVITIKHPEVHSISLLGHERILASMRSWAEGIGIIKLAANPFANVDGNVDTGTEVVPSGATICKGGEGLQYNHHTERA
jgi:hypothetical protein